MAQYYVATTGSDSNPGTAAAPFKTISHAGAVAVAGSIVNVAAGTYSESPIISASGAAGGLTRYISAAGFGAKIVAGSALHSSALTVTGDYVSIEGFDITGGGAVGLDLQGSHDEAHGNYVHDIPAPGNDGFGGAGIDFSNFPSKTGGTATGNIVARIGSYDAAGYNNSIQGLYAAIPNVTFSGNIVYGVLAYAVNIGHYAINCTIVNNTLFGNGNVALDSGGVVITGTDAGPISSGHVVRSNIIYDNLGIGIHEEGAQGANIYSNNLVYQNDTNFGNMNGQSNTGNVAASPLFVTYLRNGAGDYHLQASSPCIAAGFSGTDIGAYPYTSSPATLIGTVAARQGQKASGNAAISAQVVIQSKQGQHASAAGSAANAVGNSRQGQSTTAACLIEDTVATQQGQSASVLAVINVASTAQTQQGATSQGIVGAFSNRVTARQAQSVQVLASVGVPGVSVSAQQQVTLAGAGVPAANAVHGGDRQGQSVAGVLGAGSVLGTKPRHNVYTSWKQR